MSLTTNPQNIEEMSSVYSRDEAGFLNYMCDTGNIDQVTMERISQAVAKTGRGVVTIIPELGIVGEVALARLLSDFFEMPLVLKLPSERFETTVDPVFLRNAMLFPMTQCDGKMSIAVIDPFTTSRAKALAYASGKTAEMAVTTATLLQQWISEFYPSLEQLVQLNTKGVESDISELDADRLRDIANDTPIVRLLNRIAGIAVERKASDIHIEPLDDRTRVRIRVDGVLQTLETVDRAMQAGLVSRIKVLAKLNIAEQRLPQDGRIKLAVRGQDIDFRVATAPSVDGESVVMRILDRTEVELELHALGFSEKIISDLKAALHQPNGIILVTGPTGSGKSTTLYAALQVLNQPEVKIFTVEDPVEVRIRGITQIPVRATIGLDFPHVLRSILRQDPDIIMIGEIRDHETAKIAVQAALTGHLVLSTLHTNSAASAITRLRNLGIEDFLLSSSLRAVLAQRLVRKCCPSCNETLHAKCAVCGGSGYRGRTVISEFLAATPLITQAIDHGAPDVEIETIASNAGMKGLLDDGRHLVANSVTNREELLRVLAQE